MATDISKVKQGIEEALKDKVVDRHSLYQLKFFVINKEPTHQGKLWRCLQELKARKETLETVENDIEDLIDTIELIDIDILRINREIGPDDLDMKEAIVKLRKIKRKKEGLQKAIATLEKQKKENEQEAMFFLNTFHELEKISPVLPFDHIDAQQEYWSEKLAEELRLKMLLQLPLDTEMVKTILCMRDNTPIKNEMINVIEKIQQKIGNAQQPTVKIENQ